MTLLIDDFRTRGEFLQRMTLDFVEAVPDELGISRRTSGLRRSANSCATSSASAACTTTRS